VHGPIRNGSISPLVGFAGFPALLLERALIAPDDLTTAQSRASRDHIELADAVMAFGVAEGDTYAALAEAAGTEVITLNGGSSSPLAVRLVPERLARRHSVVPLEVDNRQLTYATCRPFNAEGESDLGFASGRRTTLKVATRTAVAAALELCYPKTAAPAAVTPAATAAAAPTTTVAAAAIAMCQKVIAGAIAAGADELQITSGSANAGIRYRIGGAFQAALNIPVEDLTRIAERLKIMARLGTAVRNRSQDGVFQTTVNGSVTHVRLTVQPTVDGDVIGLRIVDLNASGTVRRVGGPSLSGKEGRRRVLVVEDEPITRMLVKVLLERDRYEVIEATNGQQAIEIATRDRPSLVLIDLNMPVMDGYEAIGALRREFAQGALPIIVLTADDGDSVQRRVLQLGADDYLIKPFEPAVLMSRVNAAFQRLQIVAA
jgi:CheY-like chemotaxis protein